MHQKTNSSSLKEDSSAWYPKWSIRHKGNDEEHIRRSFLSNLVYTLGKDEYTCTPHDEFLSLAYTIRERLTEQWILTQQHYHKKNAKRINYLSLEYLPGRFLENNSLNIGVRDTCESVLKKHNVNFEDLLAQEQDAGLGNGGLGRLASCYLDSMATLELPAIGYGIRYQYGIFKQLLKDGRQHEVPEAWLQLTNPWEIARPEYRKKIRFYGRTIHDQGNDHKAPSLWVDSDEVIAIPHDTPIAGFGNNTVNTLRLWSAFSTNELNLQEFNRGDYFGACDKKIISESISKVLYPSDNTPAGRELRLKQQFFFTSASLQDIIRRYRTDNGDKFDHFPDKVAIHLNETHPAIAIPELMRIFVDECYIPWPKAWDIVTRVFAYTNHTLMPEALEKWPVSLMANLLPRHMEIIYEINLDLLRLVSERFPGDSGKLRSMSIIEEGYDKQIRMANLAIAAAHSVNGVSRLHSSLMQSHVFADFYRLWPEKFNNKTNGITQRRWLFKCNPSLSQLITGTIGGGWEKDLPRLKGLVPHADNPEFRKRWREIKAGNKKRLADALLKFEGVVVNPKMLFDVHIKRIHEYKRQLLNILYCIACYNRIIKGKTEGMVPRAVMFAGKAAPGYFMAKLIIELINRVAEKINGDPRCKSLLQVHFIPNYRVSLAEYIIPAADLSEQISTAGTEASGTGNMKLALNGAITIGTMDGANIEIREEIGADNMFIFGLNAEEVANLRAAGYNSREYYNRCPDLKQAVDAIESGFFCPEDPTHFDPICSMLLDGGDYFLVMADFESYMRCHEEAMAVYRDKELWTAKSILNVANMGYFSSDRALREYAEQTWRVKPVPVP